MSRKEIVLIERLRANASAHHGCGEADLPSTQIVHVAVLPVEGRSETQRRAEPRTDEALETEYAGARTLGSLKFRIVFIAIRSLRYCC